MLGVFTSLAPRISAGFDSLVLHQYGTNRNKLDDPQMPRI